MAGAARLDVDSDVERVAQIARTVPGIDHFEVRGEVQDDRRYQVDRTGPRGIQRNRLAGVSIRVWSGGASAYAFCTDPTPEDLRALVDRATRSAVSGARRGAKTFAPALATRRASYAPTVNGHPMEASHDDVLDLTTRSLQAAEDAAPGARAVSNFGFQNRRLVRTDSQDSWIERETLHSTLFTHVTVRADGRFGEYLELEGGEKGIGDYGSPEAIGQEAARLALECTRAKLAPAGRQRVMLDPHLAGLLAHESFGHLTEYDVVAPGWSLLKDRRGERFAAESLSIVDAPTPPGSDRSGMVVPIDDEGEAGKTIRMLDKGVLSGYLHQRDSAPIEGETITGNARALDIRFQPMVRMRNTWMEPGQLSFDEALELLGDGLYLCGGRGGAPHSDGSYMFMSRRAYRVVGGEIQDPLVGPSIQGNVLDILPRVEGLTKDVRMFTNTFGGCGKFDQYYLHVSLGGPCIVADGMLVGGQTA